jgi:integrase
MISQGFDWRHPDPQRIEEQLAHYRNHLEARGLVRGRIKRVMQIICDFYEWSLQYGYIDELPLTYESVTLAYKGKLAHVNPGRLSARAILMPKTPRRRRYPRYFDRQQQNQIAGLLSERDRLIVEWALYTGAREFEISNLRVNDIPPQSVYRSRRAYQLKLIRKGGGVGYLCVPTWLLDKTHQYIRFFGRRATARATIERRGNVADNIFLSRWGEPLRPDSIYRNFKTALKQSGLEGVFHDLRHTYAISMLDKLMRQARHAHTDGLNALHELSVLMGHASTSSTRIYLMARQFYLSEIDSDIFDLPEQYAHE